MKKLIYIFLLFPFITTGQVNLDSLWNNWKNETLADSTRFSSIIKLTEDGYLYNMPDSALYFYDLAYQFATSNNNQKNIVKALDGKGITRLIKGDYEESIKYFNEALAINEAHQWKIKSADNYGNLGGAYMALGQYTKAIDYYNKSLKIAEELNIKELINPLLNNFGVIHLKLKNYDKSLTYFERSLKLTNDSALIDKCGILMNIGVIYNAKGEHQKALDSYNKCLTLLLLGNNQSYLLSCYSFLGTTYLHLQNRVQAKSYILKSLKLGEDLGISNQRSSDLLNLGKIYLHQNKLDSALIFSNEALKLSQQRNTTHLSKKASKLCYLIYKGRLEHTKALEMLELMVDFNEKLQITAVQKTAIRQDLNYEHYKQTTKAELEFESEQLKSRITLWSLIISFVIILLLISFIYLRRHDKIANEREKLLIEIKLLKEQELFSAIISNDGNEEKGQLNQENIEHHIGAKLNQTDWNILTIVYNNPLVSNKEIANTVHLSVDGVSSSLRKMYKHFDITESKRSEKKLQLIVAAARLSNKAIAR